MEPAASTGHVHAVDHPDSKMLPDALRKIRRLAQTALGEQEAQVEQEVEKELKKIKDSEEGDVDDEAGMSKAARKESEARMRQQIEARV